MRKEIHVCTRPAFKLICSQLHVVCTVFCYICIKSFQWFVLHFGKDMCAPGRRTNSYVHVASFGVFDHLLCTRAKNALQWHFFIPQIIHFSHCLHRQSSNKYFFQTGEICYPDITNWYTNMNTNTNTFMNVKHFSDIFSSLKLSTFLNACIVSQVKNISFSSVIQKLQIKNKYKYKHIQWTHSSDIFHPSNNINFLHCLHRQSSTFFLLIILKSVTQN